MGEALPIVIVLIALLLVGVALVALHAWTKHKEREPGQPIIRNKKAFFAQWLAGLAIALAGAFFMFEGHLFGENTSGIATVVGIVGISLIATSNVTLLGFRRKG